MESTPSLPTLVQLPQVLPAVFVASRTTSPGTALEVNGTVTATAFAGDGSALTGISGTPTGVISAYGGSSAPSGWLMCDGAAVSRTTYSDLFTAISTTYGAGDGSTTFNLPDLQQRFPLGKAASGTGSTLGDTGGAIDHTHAGPSHTHSAGTLAGPSHTHTGPSHTHTYNQVIAHTHTYGFSNTVIGSAYVGGTSGGNSAGQYYSTGSTGSASASTGAGGTGATGASGTGSVTGSTAAAGTGATGSNNPPFLVVNYIIKT